jgi:hypothetical protein
MYVWRNITARSCKRCCCGNAVNVAYWECVRVCECVCVSESVCVCVCEGERVRVCVCVCVCVALVIKSAMRMRHIVWHLWLVRLYDILPRYLINDMTFARKKLLNTKCVF